MRFYAVLERPIKDSNLSANSGQALARVVEAHPALQLLMDFHSVDPRDIALAVGMVYPYEEDGADDLDELDLGLMEWHEPSLGLVAVRRAFLAVRDDQQSVAAAIYDPGLRPADVVSDLEALEQTLLLAQQHETRFHFVLRE